MQRGALTMTLVLTLALLACKKGNEGDTKPTTTATPEATAATAAPPAASAAPAAVGKPPSFKVGDVPEIPSEKSNPPQGAEWNQGVAVNTQGANSRGKRCSMFVLREWLNIYCTGKVIGYEKKEDFGQINVDYYEKIVAGKYASFVIRLKKGHYPKIRICREKDRASLFVNWPPTKDKPMHVALGAGPECDGSDWGVGYGKKGGDSMKAKAGADDSDDDAYMQQLRDNDERAAKACSAGDTDACWTYCGAANCS